MTATKLAEVVDVLFCDGDTHDLEDGRTLRLRIEHDEGYDPFLETDCYGNVMPVDDRTLRNRDTGRYERPESFDGNAEKIQGGRSDTYWWQPPADGPKRGTPEFAKLRAHVSDLLERGCYLVAVEVLAGEDAYLRPIVTNVAALGGVDSVDNEFLSEIVSDLVAELDPWGKA